MFGFIYYIWFWVSGHRLALWNQTAAQNYIRQIKSNDQTDPKKALLESQLKETTTKLKTLQADYDHLVANPVVKIKHVSADESELKEQLVLLLARLDILQKEYNILKENPEVKIIKEIEIVHVSVPQETNNNKNNENEEDAEKKEVEEKEKEREKENNDNTGKDETPTVVLAPPLPPPPPPPKIPGPPPPPLGKGKPKPMMAPTAKTGPVPKIKMVQFNWKKTTVPNSDQSTTSGQSTRSFWASASDRMDDMKSEFGNLEDLFGAKKPLLKAEGSFIFPNSPAGGALDDKPKSSVVTLLDFKRVQALSILLSRLKMTNEEIRAAILSLDAQKISPEDLNNLQKNAPTPDEIEVLRSYPDDPSTLGKPEQFFLAIMDIPRLTHKLEAFLFTQKFAAHVGELNPDIETLSQACAQLKGSQKFAKVLELVLAMGNFVNGGTFRGGFYGFKLDSLLHLQEVKSPVDHKTSLLHYFGRFLREKYPDLLNFADELPALDSAKRISLQTISSEVGTLRKELRAAFLEAENSKGDSQSVSIALKAALETITPQFDSVEIKLGQVQKEFVDLVTYFGDEPNTTPEDFFSIITRFTTQLEAVHKDAANEKERAEREAKRAQRKSTGTPLKPTSSSLFFPSTPSTPTTNVASSIEPETPGDDVYGK